MKPIFLHTPMAIVAFLELGHGEASLCQVLEDTTVKDLFLQRSIESFGNTIGLRFGDQSAVCSTALLRKGFIPPRDLLRGVDARQQPFERLRTGMAHRSRDTA